MRRVVSLIFDFLIICCYLKLFKRFTFYTLLKLVMILRKLFSWIDHKKLLQDAKLELKKSKRKDYYKILNVSKTASDDEIKKAYRKEALKHHPGIY